MPSTARKRTHPYDFFARGKIGTSPSATFVFCILRALDVAIQYHILANGLGASMLRKVGFEVIPNGPPIQTSLPFVEGVGLSPYRLLLLAMAMGGALKHILWAIYFNREPLWISSAIAAPIYYAMFNSLNDLFSTTMFFSASITGRTPAVVIGSVLYLVGLTTETVAEYQRKVFKDDPKNDGKLCTGGLWSVTRHINYTGYTLWRTGYSLAAGNWYWGGFMAMHLIKGFGSRAIPILNWYCSEKYGTQWEEFKKQTPYQLIPGVW
ncbi:hypothetical protein CPB83DRAFT_897268 [Crepidotus variabilis]|uniref:Steroid 5-alpha reductase C-terminal domain-containing protein n=1 Tax=Crepidotus variabilis TaxID=179855 RepID=A0A9P6E9B6_9AGAR|nr:hypothetical protein CPB83DRAFT_897268 [Crepidotus variabilis]